MSLTHFDFSKSWENAEDFPTYEENEAQVRADMQCLYDELKNGLNNLMSELEAKTSGKNGASSIGIAPQAGTAIEGTTNVMDAIGALAQALVGITLDQVADNSVTTVKLTDSAVTTPKLAGEAVTTAKLADGAVTGGKTDFSAGLTINGTLSQQGQIILDSNCFGDRWPETVTPGRLFFKRVGAED